MSSVDKTNTNTLNQPKESASNYNTKNDERDYQSGYVKKLFTEQDVCTSGIIYRYINNVDPNKDLICDTAKYGGPLHIITVTDEEAKKLEKK